MADRLLIGRRATLGKRCPARVTEFFVDLLCGLLPRQGHPIDTTGSPRPRTVGSPLGPEDFIRRNSWAGLYFLAGPRCRW